MLDCFTSYEMKKSTWKIIFVKQRIYEYLSQRKNTNNYLPHKKNSILLNYNSAVVKSFLFSDFRYSELFGALLVSII